jgi:O-antigen/teichoic acid export membrane protein
MKSTRPSLTNSLKWTLADYIFNKGSYFLTTIYLARILGPNEFSIFGILAIFTLIGNTLIDSGLSNSLLRQEQISQKEFDTIFVTNVSFSLALYILIYTLSPLLAKLLNQPKLDFGLKIYCFSFVISSLRAIHNTHLLNKLDFRKITALNIPGNIISAVFAIYLAKNNYGHWSLIILYLSNQIITTCIYWICIKWYPKISFDVLLFKKHFKFGYKLLIASQINIIFDNLNSFFIAGKYPTTTLSYYERANTLNFYPVSIISSVLQKISLPFFSKMLDDKERIKTTYLKLLNTSFFITITGLLFLNISIDKIVILFLGKNWLPMILFFQLLSINYILYTVHALNLTILNLFGRSDLFLLIEMIKKSLLFLVILISFRFGIYGLIIGNIFVSFISFFINAFYSSRFIDIGILTQVKNLFSILIPTLIIGAFMYFIRIVLINFDPINFVIIYTLSILLLIMFIYKFFIGNFIFNFLTIR